MFCEVTSDRLLVFCSMNRVVFCDAHMVDVLFNSVLSHYEVTFNFNGALKDMSSEQCSMKLVLTDLIVIWFFRQIICTDNVVLCIILQAEQSIQLHVDCEQLPTFPEYRSRQLDTSPKSSSVHRLCVTSFNKICVEYFSFFCIFEESE